MYSRTRPQTSQRCNMKKSSGFTLLEILLVVAAIAILAGIVIVAINPAKQLAETRDAQRRSDVNTISSAVAQYMMKTGNSLALSGGDACADAAYNGDGYGICESGESCGGVALDDFLMPDYIVAIPEDPSSEADDGFSGYTIFELPSNRILVCAPLTEEAEETISVTR